MTDLLRVDPQNDLGRKILARMEPGDWSRRILPRHSRRPAFRVAYSRSRTVDYFQRIADFYLDKRPAWDGEFGGGLGDDSDFTNLFPSLA